MTVSSVLIVGGDAAGRSAALALVAQDIEVSVIGGAVPDSTDELRARGVEVRSSLSLVGVLDVDGYVEAELSDGRIENYDVVLLAGAHSSISSPRVIEIPDAAAAALVVADLTAGRLPA